MSDRGRTTTTSSSSSSQDDQTSLGSPSTIPPTATSAETSDGAKKGLGDFLLGNSAGTQSFNGDTSAVSTATATIQAALQPATEGPYTGAIVGSLIGVIAVLGLVAGFLLHRRKYMNKNGPSCIWFRRRSVKKESALRTSAMDEGQSTFGTIVEIEEAFVPASPPPTATIYESDKKAVVAAALGDFLVASKLAAPPEKVGLFDRLEELPHDRKLDRNFEAPDNGRVPDSKLVVSKHSGGVADEGQHSAWISATELPSKKVPISHSSVSPPVTFALSNETNSSSSHHIALPINPKDWSEDEVGQWMLERFKDAELSSLALSQRINGRALLMLERPDIVSWLKIDTVGQMLLFEEGIAELRRQSAQQSALDQENPPSYE
ncbi:hypothetical protein BJ741DRAFT_592432 [Chytriomyces cf. hyalinus JEL632]|nr:hypothetical protein BJ741DRAFT_592432 [Chytriomyces cf. hyalinus JEL632]